MRVWGSSRLCRRRRRLAVISFFSSPRACALPTLFLQLLALVPSCSHQAALAATLAAFATRLATTSIGSASVLRMPVSSVRLACPLQLRRSKVMPSICPHHLVTQRQTDACGRRPWGPPRRVRAVPTALSTDSNSHRQAPSRSSAAPIPAHALQPPPQGNSHSPPSPTRPGWKVPQGNSHSPPSPARPIIRWPSPPTPNRPGT